MSFNVNVLAVNDSSHMEECLLIRHLVFGEEQNVPRSIDVDGLDSICHQFLAKMGDQALGTGRLRSAGSFLKFERIATLKSARGLGVGKSIMTTMQSFGAREYPTLLPFMCAQESAADFYHKLGWIKIGNPFSVASMAHSHMMLPPAKINIDNLRIWNDPECEPDLKCKISDVLGKIQS